jgi:acyl-CoA reductase-like NAD-dependent aldehyde dehydrogenase
MTTMIETREMTAAAAGDPAAEVEAKAKAAKDAARRLATVGTEVKNRALHAMAAALDAERALLLDANRRDIAVALDRGLTPHLIDRLSLNDRRIDAMREGLAEVARLPDPVGGIVGGWTRPNGLAIQKVRVPLGVLGIIYESRPNVTVDAAALCLKAGNAVVLRGGSEAIHSNIALAGVIARAAEAEGIPAGAIALIESTDRAAARHLMTLNRYVDCLIPRGGASLIETVVKNATVPVIETGTGTATCTWTRPPILTWPRGSCSTRSARARRCATPRKACWSTRTPHRRSCPTPSDSSATPASPCAAVPGRRRGRATRGFPLRSSRRPTGTISRSSTR